MDKLSYNLLDGGHSKEKEKPIGTNWEKCSVIIQCFNEEKTIVECIKRINAAVPGAEIIVVFGGNDNTAKNASSLQKEIPSLRVIENRPDFGKGHATKVGILAAKNNFQAEIDGDIQFDPEDLPLILKPLLDGESKFVIGSRHMSYDKWEPEAKNFARDNGNRFLAWLVSFLTGSKVTDVTTGLRGWNRNFVKTFWFNDDKYLYPVEMLIRALATNQKILEVPISYSGRKNGKAMHDSTREVFNAGLSYSVNIFKLWYNVKIRKNILAETYPNPSSTKLEEPLIIKN